MVKGLNYLPILYWRNQIGVKSQLHNIMRGKITTNCMHIFVFSSELTLPIARNGARVCHSFIFKTEGTRGKIIVKK
jgi:hypothetical protein